MRGKRNTRAALGMAAASVILGTWSSAWAGLSFSGSTSKASLTHDPDTTATSDTVVVKSPSVVPTSANMPVPPSYHIHNTYPAGAVSPAQNTYAVGSIGQVTNPTTASFVLVSGTGITQEDPKATMGTSSLTINVDLRWDVTAGGFSPSTAYASIPVGFNIGAGGSGSFSADLLWSVGSGGSGSYRWTPSQTFGPGKWTQTFTTPAGAILGDGSQPAGALVRLRGTLTFRADNESSPSSVFPINAEVGAAPVSYTYIPNLEGGGVWSDPGNWVNDPDGRAFPDAPGERARFMNGMQAADGGLVNTGPQSISVIGRIQVGSLDIDSDQPYTFVGTDGDLTFTSTIGRDLGTPSVLNVRNANGNAHHVFNTNLGINTALDMIVDSTGGVSLASQVFGSGGIVKSGKGPAELSSAKNTYAGGTQLLQGPLIASATGALGTGDVTVDGGMLDYRANGAADHGVVVNSAGFVNLGIVPNATDHFDLRGGAIGGSPEALQGLNSRLLTIAPGSMIVHQKFDADAASGNPLGLDPSTPQYIFGVGADMTGELQAGSGAKTPWIGLGGDPGAHTFGGAWAVLGSAELRVLEDGVLKIGAKVTGGEDSRIDKTGAGTATFEGTNNDFAGIVTVSQGLLQVNGTLKPKGVLVRSGGALGGQGLITGPVEFEKGTSGVGGHLVPGAGIGTLTVGTLGLVSDSQLDWELDTPARSDLVHITGDNLVLDGLLNLADTDFGPGTYTLMRFDSGIVDNGLEIGLATDVYQYEIVVDRFKGAPGGVVLLNVTAVPEPAGLGVLALAAMTLLRRRRSATARA